MVAVVLAGLAGLAGCGEGGVHTLTLSGSSTMAPLVGEIAERFAREHPGVEVNVQAGGSSKGIADLRRGLVDIGMASRALAPDEQELTATTIARDGVAMIVHASNPLRGIDSGRIVTIYTGEIENWSALGLPAAPITVVNKAAGRATLAVFLDYTKLAAPDIEADLVVGGNEQAIRSVAANPGAIGYVSIGTASYHAANGTPIRLLALAGVPATPAAVASGDYPMTRALNLVTAEAPTGLAAAFIDYARSPAVHDLVRAFQFVPATR